MKSRSTHTSIWSGISTLAVHILNQQILYNTLWKHAFSNILKISPPKTLKFSDKNSDILHTSAQNIDCGYSLELPLWGSSNEYPQSMFLSRNKKINVYHCKPQFYYIKVGFNGVKIIQACFQYEHFGCPHTKPTDIVQYINRLHGLACKMMRSYAITKTRLYNSDPI